MAQMNFRRLNRHFKEALRRCAQNKINLHGAFKEEGGYSPECAMDSAAGWYLGEYYWDADYKFWCPGARISGYFATEQEVLELFPHAMTGAEAMRTAGTMYASGPGVFLPRKTLEYVYQAIPVLGTFATMDPGYEPELQEAA